MSFFPRGPLQGPLKLWLSYSLVMRGTWADQSRPLAATAAHEPTPRTTTERDVRTVALCLEPLAPEVRVCTRDDVLIEGSIGAALNADRRPPAGLACGSLGLSRGSLLNPFEPHRNTANLTYGLFFSGRGSGSIHNVRDGLGRVLSGGTKKKGETGGLGL